MIETCISGLCLPLGNRNSWFSGPETCEEDTSMPHVNHAQLGNLIFSLASSAKSSTVKCGMAIRCGSSQPLWENTTVLSTIFLPKIAGVFPMVDPLFCSQLSLPFLLLYIHVHEGIVEQRKTCKRGSIVFRNGVSPCSLYCSERFNSKFF